MSNQSVKTEGEYFEHEPSLLFKDIKRELQEEILLKEKEEVRIDLEHESSLSFKDIKKELQEEILLKEEDLKKIDFDAEVQKILSGIDLINCFIQNFLLGLQDTETDQFLSSLKKIEHNIKKISNFEEISMSCERINVDKIKELEHIIFPPEMKVDYHALAKSNSEFDGLDIALLRQVTKFCQNFINYKCESKLKFMKNNWSKSQKLSPEIIEERWGKLMVKIKTKLEIKIESYDYVMKNIIRTLKIAMLEECVCHFEDPEMVWHRHDLCDDGVKFIKEYCGLHVGKVVLSEAHCKKCTKCSDTLEKNCKKRDKILAKDKRRMDRKIELKKKKISTTLNNDKETVCITVSSENPKKITSESGEINVESIDVGNEQLLMPNTKTQEYDNQIRKLDMKMTNKENIASSERKEDLEDGEIEDTKTDSLKRKTSDDYICQMDNVSNKKARNKPL